MPLIVLNVQRAGPSTGLPTKTEQSDLHQAVFGRNADTPLAVIAARSPGDCFNTAIEAARIATKYMTPVILLADGYMANASEPWLIPDVTDLEEFKVDFHTETKGFYPFQRNEKTLGTLFCFFILETILLGRALNVNPFDQPSVELIKKETKKILY